MKTRFRPVLLLALLFAVATLYFSSLPSAALPWFTKCDKESPAWLDTLVEEIKVLGYPGFQLSVADVNGQRMDCAAGWSSPIPGTAPLNLNHRMRYASLSKILTSSVAIQLIDEGLLNPELHLVELLKMTGPFVDERMASIRIDDLLRHKAGFDRALTPDPMMQPHPWCPGNLAALKSIRIDHDPGSHFAYANIGYCLLGAVISGIEDKSLDQVFHDRLLNPLSLQSIRALRHGEIFQDEPQAFFDDAHESQNDLLAIDYAASLATGAWSGTASDFMSLLISLFARNEHALLSDQAQTLIFKVAPECDFNKWRTCHGYGFYKYKPVGQKAMYWRDGSLPGVTAFAAVFEDGTKVVFLANGRTYNWMASNDRIGQLLYRFITEDRSGR